MSDTDTDALMAWARKRWPGQQVSGDSRCLLVGRPPFLEFHTEHYPNGSSVTFAHRQGCTGQGSTPDEAVTHLLRNFELLATDAEDIARRRRARAETARRVLGVSDAG